MLLNDFVKGVEERNFNVYGIVVKQHGQIIANKRFRNDDFVQLYSGSKTFAAVAVMLAIDEGYFKLEDKVIDFFDEEYYKDSLNDNLKELTVYHLLTMTTGHEGGSLDVNYYEETGNWAKMFFDKPFVHKPGKKFDYDNGATYILSVIFQDKVGMSLKEYLMPRLFRPLGIYNPQWDVSPEGYCKGYIGLHLTTELYSRLGQLFLDKGKYNGVQVVKEEIIDLMIKKHIDNTGNWNDDETGSGYGFQLWRNSIPNSYRFDGLYGQFCIVLPDYDAVITTTCHQEIAQNDILRLIWSTILPKLK